MWAQMKCMRVNQEEQFEVRSGHHRILGIYQSVQYPYCLSPLLSRKNRKKLFPGLHRPRALGRHQVSKNLPDKGNPIRPDRVQRGLGMARQRAPGDPRVSKLAALIEALSAD